MTEEEADAHTPKIIHVNEDVYKRQIEGHRAEEFLEKSRAASIGAAEFVLEHHAAGQSEEEILKEYADKYYYGLCDKACLLYTSQQAL